MNLVIVGLVAAGAAVVLAMYNYEIVSSVLRDLVRESEKDEADRRARDLLGRHRRKTREAHNETKPDGRTPVPALTTTDVAVTHGLRPHLATAARVKRRRPGSHQTRVFKF